MKRFYHRIKWFIQRGRRGYADCDVVDMDSYLIKTILPMLKQLKEIKHGHPHGTTSEEWDQILSDMIAGFEAGKHLLEDNYMDEIQPGWYDPTKDGPDCVNISESSYAKEAEMQQKDKEKFEKKGLALLTDWFFALWD